MLNRRQQYCTLTHHSKIVWPEEWSEDHAEYHGVPVFLYSVDGIHCRINEPFHATLAKDTKSYSHKFNQAGVTYELALSVHTNDLVWMNGPFQAATPDISVFRKEGGLKEKTPAGKKGIGDYGYRGERDMLSTPNSHDPRELRKFKVSDYFALALFCFVLLVESTCLLTSCFAHY
jgi:hypothetical protein